MRKKSQKIICYSIEILVLIIFIFSYLYLIFNSLKDKEEYYQNPWGIPSDFHFENFINFITNFGAGRYWLNTLIYSIIAIMISMPISIICAFALRIDRRKRFTKTFLFIIVGLHFFPEVITLEPLYRILSAIGAIKNHYAVIIMYIKALLPTNILFLYISFRKINRDTIDNYVLDGLSWPKFFLLELPKMCKSEMVALIALNIFMLFKDYTIAYIFINEDIFSTINIAISRYLSISNLNYPQYFAAIITTEIPFLVAVGFAFIKIKPTDFNRY